MYGKYASEIASIDSFVNVINRVRAGALYVRSTDPDEGTFRQLVHYLFSGGTGKTGSRI